MEVAKFPLICIAIFLFSSCTNEYFDFHAERKIEKEYVSIIKNWSFSPEMIEDRDVSILDTPDKKALDTLVSKIESSQDRVYMETYILTEKRLLKSLLDAKYRGVDVRVILEKNVYGATNINKKSFDALTKSGVQVVYSDSEKYVFTHSKFLIIDEEYVIGTGNMSYSSFTENREFFVTGKDPQDLSFLTKLFLADFEWKTVLPSNSNIYISPLDSRRKIEGVLQSATGSIYMFAQSLSDPRVIQILKEKKKQWLEVKVCLWDLDKVESNRGVAQELKESGISVGSPKKPYVHAKSILVDKQYLAIGSVNFTTNSMDFNREVWIVLKNSPFNRTFFKLFQSDCPVQ